MLTLFHRGQINCLLSSPKSNPKNQALKLIYTFRPIKKSNQETVRRKQIHKSFPKPAGKKLAQLGMGVYSRSIGQGYRHDVKVSLVYISSPKPATRATPREPVSKNQTTHIQKGGQVFKQMQSRAESAVKWQSGSLPGIGLGSNPCTFCDLRLPYTGAAGSHKLSQVA